MSAWDVTGALVFTPLTVMFWLDVANGEAKKASEDDRLGIFSVGIILTAAAIFCIARLCGAHA